MNQHVTEWLARYYDGELSGARLRQVESHLIACAACQQELEALRNLSALLQLDAAPRPITSQERFVAQVGLRLPTRKPRSPSLSGARRWGWWLFPLGVLSLQAFMQAVLLVTGLVVMMIFNNQWAGLDVSAWNIAESIGQLALLEILAAVVTAALLGGWLASWIANQKSTFQR